MWLKLVFALTYVILLFVFSRIVNVAVRSGLTCFFMPSTNRGMDLHPSNMGAKELKKILDQRGIPYERLIEKREFRQMIQASGQVSYEEINELSAEDDSIGVESSTSGSSSQMTASSLPTTTQITSGGHFYEMVEDTKDSAWLILVLPFISSIASAFTHSSSSDWWTIANKVSKFGIRVAVFECKNDVSFCDHRGWKSPRLILALPKNHEKAKSDVILKQYLLSYTVSPRSIIRWIHSELASRVTIIESLSSLKNDWLEKTTSNVKNNNGEMNGENTGKSITNVIWFSTLEKAPLSLSGLAIKFNGRANIYMIRVDSKSISKLQTILPGVNISSMVVTLANGSYYICHSCTTFSQMNLILKTLLPDMNDVFSLSLYLVNISVLIHFFWLKCSKFWRHITFWLMEIVKVNCLLFLTWLAILALCRFPSFKSLVDYLNLVTQLLASYISGETWRQDFSSFTKLPFIVTTLVTCGCFFGWLRRNKLPSNSTYSAYDDDQLFRDWAPLESTILSYILFRPMNSVSGARSNLPSTVTFEEGMELLIERLAVPNLWLQADLVSNEYIKDLPLWLHPGTSTSDESDSDATSTTENDSLDESYKCTKLKRDEASSSSSTLNANCTSSQDQSNCRCSAKSSTESLAPGASNSSANVSTNTSNLSTGLSPASPSLTRSSNCPTTTSRQSNYTSTNSGSNNEKVRKRRQPNSTVPPGKF